MHNEIVLEGDCELFSVIDGDYVLFSVLDGQYGQFIEVHTDDQYTGDYTVTPTNQSQVLHTNNKVLFGDITVAPIPSNYGLITWNGTCLTIT